MEEYNMPQKEDASVESGSAVPAVNPEVGAQSAPATSATQPSIVDAPAQPAVAPVQPAVAPAQPAVAPVQPAVAPAQPGNEPAPVVTDATPASPENPDAKPQPQL